jgi:cytochrome c-type biogenesis protein CcmH/NrfG
MPQHPTDLPVHDEFWRPKVVYGMATVCLLLGLALGYLLRGSESPAAKAGSTTEPKTTEVSAQSAEMPSLEQMKAMANRKIEPLLAKLKSDPKNKDLLIEIASFYKSAHLFKEAADSLDRALQSDPKNIAIRTEMASCLYFDGNVDGALAALQESLRENPRDANALFNLGLIRWKGKNDAAGAIAAWRELLRTNPKLDKKPIVERMLAEAEGKSGSQSLHQPD